MDSEVTPMNHLTSIELAGLRQHEVRVEAAHARLAVAARRGRRRRHVDRRDRITHRWRRRRRDAVTAPATTTGGHPVWTH
jgi:hypothetical protein